MKYFWHNLLFFALLIAIPGILFSQEKELHVKYNFEEKYIKRPQDGYSSLPPRTIDVYAYGNEVITVSTFCTNIIGLTKGYRTPVTIYDYLKVDYGQAYLLEPVFSHLGEFDMLLNEPLDLFDWQLGKETKTILGYKCFNASCSFRGREYIAYFTREIPFKAAPWKFHGLPGVILEVYSTDDFCRWTAKSLKIKPHERNINLPFDGKKMIDLEEYKNILSRKQKSYKEARKRLMIEYKNNSNIIISPDSIPPNDIEIFDLGD